MKVNGFACSCGEENKKLIQEIREWAFKFVKSDDPSLFLTRVVWNLSSRYSAEITGIPNDPGGWSGISAKSLRATKDKESLETWIECDRVEDGLALTLKKFYDHYGERLTWEEEDDEEDSDSTSREQ